ncbi:MAG: alpha/beta fold hydrolase [Rhodospirillales bacterium]
MASASGNSEKITFTGSQGDALAARLDRPAGAPRAFVLWAHCFTCTKDIFAASRVAGRLTDSGFAVLRFDFTGLGASEGEFANTNFSSNVDDLVAAADWLRSEHEAPALLIGHSLGGAAVLAAAERVPEAVGVCTIGAPADPGHVAHLFTDAVADIEAEGEAEVLLSGRPFRIRKQFLDDLAAQSLDDRLGHLKKALLVMHAPRDATVGIENATAIFTAARHPKSFISLDDADHLLSRKADAVYAADIIAAWASRFIAANGDAAAAGFPPVIAGPDEVIVAETGTGRFTQHVSVGGRHLLRADEPPGVGGADEGPTPYDFLLTALGACKAMTVRMYANRKGIDFDRISVTLSHDKVHAEDCEHCETREGKIDRISVEIGIDGDLDAETRQRLYEIADKCPVHRTLQGEIWIESNLKD